MQIENNQLKEELEAANYELKNKINQMEIALNEAEDDKKRQSQMAARYKDKLDDAEKKNLETADELVRLQNTIIALNAANDKQVMCITYFRYYWFDLLDHLYND